MEYADGYKHRIVWNITITQYILNSKSTDSGHSYIPDSILLHLYFGYTTIAQSLRSIRELNDWYFIKMKMKSNLLIQLNMYVTLKRRILLYWPGKDLPCGCMMHQERPP